MDQHPIPQDVTGFQFKLIGNMTVKQFAYVAVGVVSAVILYYLPLGAGFGVLFKLFFIPLLGGGGAAVAFLPLDGRPVDVMATNFARAIFSPNQYIYHKDEHRFSFSMIELSHSTSSSASSQTRPAAKPQRVTNAKEQKLQALLQNSSTKIHNELDRKEQAFLQSFSAAIHSETPPIIPPIKKAQSPEPASMVPSQPATNLHVLPPMVTQSTSARINVAAIQNEEMAIEQQLQSAQQQEKMAQTTQVTASAHEKVLLLEKQLQQVHIQKQQLEQELQRLKQQAQLNILNVAPAITKPADMAISAQIVQSQQQIRKISKPVVKNSTLPNIPDTPNIIVGIVKDSRGNILPNILVEIKDKDNNPVRAFKTSALGQFASATPLTNGMYTLELEDPKRQHTFDALQVIVNNRILMPLEIISHDAREQLRRELFN